MLNKILFFALNFAIVSSTIGQTNIVCTNPIAEQVMKGNYNPATYTASNVINQPNTIAVGIQSSLSTDSLKSYLLKLSSFKNRNTGSDTVSNTTGIGAARRWVYAKFQQFSAANENRLLPSYLQFDQLICGMQQHKNIFAVLPGMDTNNHAVIIVEAHIDSRCAGLCDTNCLAEGAEDNASGTALVLELARIMSTYSFNQTLVFLITIGEEQGLDGAQAFANYTSQKSIKVKAVFNNDVVGGIICGHTASPPGCPGFGDIDSTHVRIFSFGGFLYPRCKNLARFIKLEYKEELLSIVNVPMQIVIMADEDRVGRGGDHIPFRQYGYRSIRFTSANENGDASNAPGYMDRQHTSNDVLGLNTDLDPELDTFFVNFNYLGRNAVINGNALAMAALGPKMPSFLAVALAAGTTGEVAIQITQQTQYNQYRIAVRTTTNDWDSVYTINGTTDTIQLTSAGANFLSVASVDSNGVESLFNGEQSVSISLGIEEVISSKQKDIILLQNKPNPFDEATIISVMVNNNKTYENAYIKISTLNGKVLENIPIKLNPGMNETLYTHGFNVKGVYLYTLVVNNRKIASKKMVFTNL